MLCVWLKEVDRLEIKTLELGAVLKAFHNFLAHFAIKTCGRVIFSYNLQENYYKAINCLYLKKVQQQAELEICIFREWVVVGGSLVTKLCLTFAAPWTVAHQTPLSMEFSRQEYWSGLPFPSLEDLSTQESNPCPLYCWQTLYC